MLATLMTALFFMVKALGQLGNSLSQEDPLPYLVHQPLPWQVHCVTQNRRASRDREKGGCSRHNSLYDGIPGRKGDASPMPGNGAEGGSDPAVSLQMCSSKYQHSHDEK